MCVFGLCVNLERWCVCVCVCVFVCVCVVCVFVCVWCVFICVFGVLGLFNFVIRGLYFVSKIRLVCDVRVV